FAATIASVSSPPDEDESLTRRSYSLPTASVSPSAGAAEGGSLPAAAAAGAVSDRLVTEPAAESLAVDVGADAGSPGRSSRQASHGPVTAGRSGQPMSPLEDGESA